MIKDKIYIEDTKIIQILNDIIYNSYQIEIIQQFSILDLIKLYNIERQKIYIDFIKTDNEYILRFHKKKNILGLIFIDIKKLDFIIEFHKIDLLNKDLYLMEEKIEFNLDELDNISKNYILEFNKRSIKN